MTVKEELPRLRETIKEGLKLYANMVLDVLFDEAPPAVLA